MGKKTNTLQLFPVIIIIIAIIFMAVFYAVDPSGFSNPRFTAPASATETVNLINPVYTESFRSSAEVYYQDICGSDFMKKLKTLEEVYCPITPDELKSHINKFQTGYILYGKAPDSNYPENPDAARYFLIKVGPSSSLLQDDTIKLLYYNSKNPEIQSHQLITDTGTSDLGSLIILKTSSFSGPFIEGLSFSTQTHTIQNAIVSDGSCWNQMTTDSPQTAVGAVAPLADGYGCTQQVYTEGNDISKSLFGELAISPLISEWNLFT
jgi:hypothetical protein